MISNLYKDYIFFEEGKNYMRPNYNSCVLSDKFSKDKHEILDSCVRAVGKEGSWVSNTYFSLRDDKGELRLFEWESIPDNFYSKSDIRNKKIESIL